MRKNILAVLFFFSSIFSTMALAGNGGVIVGFVNPDGEIVFEFEIDKEFLNTKYPIQSFLMEQGDFDYLKDVMAYRNSYIFTQKYGEFEAEVSEEQVSEALIDENEISILVDDENVISLLPDGFFLNALNSFSKK